MCGFFGILRPGGLTSNDATCARSMGERLSHRGPDDQGLWQDAAAGVLLGHQRLSIVDLSPAGAQPMRSHSGRYVIAYNGEIYNHADLRHRLEDCGQAPDWSGTSDTEVLLAAIETWGLKAVLKLAKGMFALALWDRHDRRMSLARDPIGEKPLYVSRLRDGAFAFASELKALTAHPAFEHVIDPKALSQLLRVGYIPVPLSLYAGTEKLAPGTITSFGLGNPATTEEKSELYYSLQSEAEEARRDRFSGTHSEATNHLETLLKQSVRQQMIADVPVGCFLSGGIDSSTISAIMQSLGSAPVETFSLGFQEADMNEADFARSIAAHLGVSHNEVVLSATDALNLLPQMPSVYDEPFCDDSMLPTFLLCQFAKQKVTVSLSGDGGDELFAGYSRYFSFQDDWDQKKSGTLSGKEGSTGANLLRNHFFDRLLKTGISNLAGMDLAARRLSMDQKIAGRTNMRPLEAYEAASAFAARPDAFVVGAVAQCDPLLSDIEDHPDWTLIEKMTTYDLSRYFPDDILVKVDRAAMANSLETRLPLLDRDIIRFSLSLPEEIQLAGGNPKSVLKSVLGRYVPQHLWNRPKKGFGIPVVDWLNGPMREMADDLLSVETLDRVGVLDTNAASSLWQRFRSGRSRRSNLVWSLLMVQLFLTSNK
ncbi:MULTISPECIES: asparagine synthase (glutamine-hydrolyzing) [Alphaproteobacteria]|uniref:asparagine synthase (glutamine-hydrolyzing) n=1 Tax=Alphaproteobacteria TaxID=28211 RepID=UPI0032674CAC